MISFWRIFSLEFTALVRSKTLALLAVAGTAWMFALPYLIRGDGTVDGARELYVHYSLGGVFALVVVAMIATGTGAIAGERTAKRLQLTLVRPVSRFSVAMGRILAEVTCGALVLALAALILAFKTDLSRPCNHVLYPVMPSPAEEAKVMYGTFMADPDTPVAIKRAKKSTVLRILAQRAVDHYQTIATNATTTWKFREVGDGRKLAVRMRFTNQLEMRQDVLGEFRLGDGRVTVSNITQAVIMLPLVGSVGSATELAFDNRGKNTLMLRPRKDLNLLVEADGFGFNLVRAYVAMVSILAMIAAICILLSTGLGRSVAIFVAFVTLAVSEMSPSVIDQYPDELESNPIDRIGLCITRFSAEITRPISELSPMSALATDECVELKQVARFVAVNLVTVPVLAALLAAFLMPRKESDMV